VKRSGNGRAGSLEEVRAGLVARLRSRGSEIERALSAHAGGLSDLAGGEDPECLVGLSAALAGALDYVLTGIELGAEWPGPIPSTVVAQAHRAARGGVDLETVLLRCAGWGHRVLLGFVIAEADELPTTALGQVLDIQALLIERLLAAVSVEHKRELERVGRSPEQRDTELVQSLLAGEPLDTGELGYELDAWHVGLIATGVGALRALRGIAAGADRQLLAVSPGEQTVWAWFGGTRRLEVDELERLVPANASAGLSLAIGEPASGGDGWRLTHRQAQAARLVALHRGGREGVTLTRYVEEMLLAAALRDEMLARSLKEIFLSPLATQRDGGATSRQTLREYLATGCNASKAADRLDVTRHTVENRLSTAEQHLGRALPTCLVEVEVALRLEELTPPAFAGENPLPRSD
jgi:hypothetical protein